MTNNYEILFLEEKLKSIQIYKDLKNRRLSIWCDLYTGTGPINFEDMNFDTNTETFIEDPMMTEIFNVIIKHLKFKIDKLKESLNGKH